MTNLKKYVIIYLSNEKRGEIKMKVFIYATEELYQGLHGIEALEVVEIENLKEAEWIGQEMAESLIVEYGLEDEYEESGIEYELNYSIYAIADEYAGMTIDELNQIAEREGYEDFIAQYCGEELV